MTEQVTFEDFQLASPLLKSLAREKYECPTPIQAEAIPHLLSGADLLGCAQTGTGKTAAFALPILNRLARKKIPAAPNAPRILILSPTRELAAQIGESFQVYGRHVRFFQTVIFGGVKQRPQVNALRRGVHVVVATPGRLIDLMEQGHVRLNELDTFVLDEADRMLDMGFLPDLKRIISKLPKNRQSLFFSATIPPKVAELASSLLKNPVRVSVNPESSTVDLIEQRVLSVPQTDKKLLLAHLLQEHEVGRVLVFTRTKRGADRVAKQLDRGGVNADAIHSDKSQMARERALKKFKNGRIQVLVATDVAARGIDVDGITHVINYDVPNEPESYVHRIGRTGRAGATGIALSFCDPAECPSLRAIERFIKQKINLDESHPFHVDMPASRRSSGGKDQFRGRKPYKSRGRGPNVSPASKKFKPRNKKRRSSPVSQGTA